MLTNRSKGLSSGEADRVSKARDMACHAGTPRLQGRNFGY